MSDIIVKCQALPLDKIAVLWQTIETPDVSFFLSWSWVGTWLATLPFLPKVFVFYMKHNPTHPVGICIGQIHTHRGLGFSLRQMYLNQTGVQRLDQSWIEYNDILASPEYLTACRFAWVDYCFASEKVDSLVINTSLYSARQWTSGNTYAIDEEHIQGFSKALQPEYQDLHTLLNSFSKNRKNQLKRAIKFIEHTFGSITLTKYTHAEAISQFPALADLHKQRWGDSEFGSGFDNPVFVDFHTRLMRIEHTEHDIHLLGFSAGDTHLGYLYNIVHNNTVNFYLSGVNYVSADNKCKVGLVMHVLAMQHYAEQGCHTYDFLGGESQYKTSLSDTQYTFNYTHLCHSLVRYQFKRSLYKMRSLLTTP